MPYLRYSANARDNLSGLVGFLKGKNLQTEQRIIARVRQGLDVLLIRRKSRSLLKARPFQRNLQTAFGDSGYMARYCYQPSHGAVVVLAIRHQKQADCSGIENQLVPKVQSA